MKVHRLPSALAAAVLCLCGTAWSQPADPAGPAGAVPVPPPPRAQPMADVGVRTPVVTGTVQRWLLNANGEADGLLLADGTQVSFPPHLSAAAMRALKPGQRVEVTGWRAPDVPVVRATALRAPDTGRRVVDEGPGARGPRPAPHEHAALDAMSASGRIERVLYTDRGDAKGVLLDDGAIVRFPPHVGAAMGDRLAPGRPIAARGWGSRGPQGRALEATALGDTVETMRELAAGPGPGEPRPPRGPAVDGPRRAGERFRPAGGPAPVGGPVLGGGPAPIGSPASVGGPAPIGSLAPAGGPAPAGGLAPAGAPVPVGGPAPIDPPDGARPPPPAPPPSGMTPPPAPAP